MAARSEALPTAIDEGGKWFWDFLKHELTPYPGRLWVVGRITIAATIVMLLVMTFRLPGGYLGAIFTLFISRENPTATFRSGYRSVLAFLAGTAYSAIGVMLLLDDPLTHFLWVAGSLFLSFFLIGVLADYPLATAFGFLLTGAIPLWDQRALNVNDRMENTLWLAGVVAMGVAVSIAIEYVFRGVHPTTDLTEGLADRLQCVESILKSVAENRPLGSEVEKSLSLYVGVGTSRLRRLILRSEYKEQFKSQISAMIALTGRLIDIAATFRLALVERGGQAAVEASDRVRCQRLADEIAALRQALVQRQLPEDINTPPHPEASKLPFLLTMENTVALIPKAFAGAKSPGDLIRDPMDLEPPARFFVADAFTNPAHVQFALRGTLAAMVCYMTYMAIDWPGLSTALPTCIITALSTIGSSRQKQVLRLGGVIVGGFIFGMGAQMFVLPYLDTIAGFTLLFAVVTAISAWIQTSSARLSYLGVQLALAFYLINLQEFTIQTSLSIARDRVFGVLLGIVSMGLFFDLLWVRNPLEEMQAVFAHNLELFAELAQQLLEEDQVKAIGRIRQLRDQLNNGFEAVRAQSDAVLLDFSPARQEKLRLRENIRRWQPTIRTLLEVQITNAQYLAQRPLTDLPESIARAGVDFEKDVACVMRAMADEVSGKPTAAVPDIRRAAARLQEEISGYYRERGLPVPPQASDVIGLAGNLASILAPLYEDIHSTTASASKTAGAQSPLLPKPVPSSGAQR
jgi:multidrug resistance protein MdtO